MRSGLPGVAGLDNSPQEFADEWSQLGVPQAAPAMGQGCAFANAMSIPSGIAGRLRATDNDASPPRVWSDQCWAEAGAWPRADVRG